MRCTWPGTSWKSTGPAAVAAVFALAACVAAGPVPAPLAPPQKELPILANASPAEPLTLTGVRHSQGNAVNCPEIRTDDGTLYPVKGLTGDIAIGTRITVTGTWGVTTSCQGRVLVIESLQKS